MVPRKPHRREGEGWLRTAWGLFERWKGPVVLLWSVIAGGVTIGVRWWWTISTVEAQGLDITNMKTRLTAVESQGTMTFRGICLQLSLDQQQLAGMECPSALVRTPAVSTRVTP